MPYSVITGYITGGKYPSRYSDYCNEIQTTMHLLWECNVAQGIWKEFQDYLSQCMDIPVCEILINKESIFLNNIHTKLTHIANFMALMIKQYIFSCKCTDKKPRFIEITCVIEKEYQIKRYNAVWNCDLRKKHKRWLIYDPVNVQKTIAFRNDKQNK